MYLKIQYKIQVNVSMLNSQYALKEAKYKSEYSEIFKLTNNINLFDY